MFYVARGVGSLSILGRQDGRTVITCIALGGDAAKAQTVVHPSASCGDVPAQDFALADQVRANGAVPPPSIAEHRRISVLRNSRRWFLRSPRPYSRLTWPMGLKAQDAPAPNLRHGARAS